jgi:hypothetical protein
MILINKPASSYLNLASYFHQTFLPEFLNGNQNFFKELRENIVKWCGAFNEESVDEDEIYDMVSPLLCELQHSFKYTSDFAKKFKDYQVTIPNDSGRFFGCIALKGFNITYSVKIQLSNMAKFYEIIEKIRDTNINILKPNVFDAFTGEFTIEEYKICFNFHKNRDVPTITIVFHEV